MAPFPVENRASLEHSDFTRLQSALATQSTMRHAMDWLLGHKPPYSLTESIPQDEFSHDILVEYTRPLWLVYDST